MSTKKDHAWELYFKPRSCRRRPSLLVDEFYSIVQKVVKDLR